MYLLSLLTNFFFVDKFTRVLQPGQVPGTRPDPEDGYGCRLAGPGRVPGVKKNIEPGTDRNLYPDSTRQLVFIHDYHV